MLCTTKNVIQNFVNLKSKIVMHWNNLFVYLYELIDMQIKNVFKLMHKIILFEIKMKYLVQQMNF